ncbi:hypothetical protein O1611_g7656 [Lasiodiplodia mahajangana]|uniref:Uncharacterized protein n=1 Tax=Lasiodiplodia mahajangana TaxID=1108764 RepID=A0ACC2JEW9_9PEZI|nr:hypothetical protein O1611_g7656 [Lasiodiplodia mahajangana]
MFHKSTYAHFINLPFASNLQGQLTPPYPKPPSTVIMSSSNSKSVPIPIEIEDKSIDLVKLAGGTKSSKTPSKTSSREGAVPLKVPETPQMPLIFPHGFTTPEEEASWEHELEYGFGSIWSAYECMYLQRQSSAK